MDLTEKLEEESSIEVITEELAVEESEEEVVDEMVVEIVSQTPLKVPIWQRSRRRANYRPSSWYQSSKWQSKSKYRRGTSGCTAPDVEDTLEVRRGKL